MQEHFSGHTAHLTIPPHGLELLLPMQQVTRMLPKALLQLFKK